RRSSVLVLVLATFAALVLGVLRAGWGFNEMAALFFVMGVMAGLVGGLGFGGAAEAFVIGFRSMAYAALLIGFARAIAFTLDKGALVAILAAAQVRYEDWLRFALPLLLGLLALGASAIGVGVAIGLQ